MADLTIRDLAEGTKQVYRDQLRLHVRPAFEHYALAEITTGRVEWFLKSQATYSQWRAEQWRTLLTLMFGFALRHDAISRNPVEGTTRAGAPRRGPRTGSRPRCWAAASPSWVLVSATKRFSPAAIAAR